MKKKMLKTNPKYTKELDDATIERIGALVVPEEHGDVGEGIVGVRPPGVASESLKNDGFGVSGSPELHEKRRE